MITAQVRSLTKAVLTDAMITQPPLKQQQGSWQEALKTLITDPLELLSVLELSPEQLSWQLDHQFPLRVPRSFVDRMKKGDPKDPLLLQVLSLKEESQLTPACSIDPLKEAHCNPVPGLLHKFTHRVLLTFTASCAIHCRYCFRRHFPYSDNNPGKKGWEAALSYIAEHPAITEVILSGGDPLIAPNKQLSHFFDQLARIVHVRLVRIHTRLPVVIPERIDAGLLGCFDNRPFQSVMVYHINHPAEIVQPIATAVRQLKEKQITVFNQSVLLKNINDNLPCLSELSYKLFDAGILPYYVHLLDPVAGAGHFAVSLETAKTLQSSLRSLLPGYLLPKFVREVPGEASKIPLDIL